MPAPHAGHMVQPNPDSLPALPPIFCSMLSDVPGLSALVATPLGSHAAHGCRLLTCLLCDGQSQRGSRSDEDEGGELTGTSLPTDIDLSFMNGQESPSSRPATALHSHNSSLESMPSLPGAVLQNGAAGR